MYFCLGIRTNSGHILASPNYGGGLRNHPSVRCPFIVRSETEKKRRKSDLGTNLLRSLCTYLKLKQIPKSLKGANGNDRLCDLYSKARRIYSKGYTAREMISSLNFSLIRNKRQSSLQELKKALGVQQTPQ